MGFASAQLAKGGRQPLPSARSWPLGPGLGRPHAHPGNGDGGGRDGGVKLARRLRPGRRAAGALVRLGLRLRLRARPLGLGLRLRTVIVVGAGRCRCRCSRRGPPGCRAALWWERDDRQAWPTARAGSACRCRPWHARTHAWCGTLPRAGDVVVGLLPRQLPPPPLTYHMQSPPTRTPPAFRCACRFAHPRFASPPPSSSRAAPPGLLPARRAPPAAGPSRRWRRGAPCGLGRDPGRGWPGNCTAAT